MTTPKPLTCDACGASEPVAQPGYPLWPGWRALDVRRMDGDGADSENVESFHLCPVCIAGVLALIKPAPEPEESAR